MAGDSTIAIDVVARLDAFQKAMAEMPEIGAAKAKQMAAEINKSVKAAERASRAAEKAAKDAKRGFSDAGAGAKGFADKAGTVGSSAKKMAGALGMISPGAAEAARGLDDLMDVAELTGEGAAALGVSSVALGAAIAVAAQAAAAAYVVYRVYSEETDRAAETTKWLADAEAKLKPLLDDTRDATIDLKVATGELTEEAGRLERASLRAFEAYQEATKETRAKLSELKGEQASVWTQMVDGAESIVPSWTPLGMAIDGFTTNTEEFQGQIDALQGSIDKATDTLRVNADTHKGVIKAEQAAKGSKEAHTAAVARMKEQIEQLNATIEEESRLAEANAQTVREGIDDMEAQERAARRALATKAELLEMDHAEALAAAETARQKARSAATELGTLEEIEATHRRTAAAEDALYYAKLDELRAEDLAAADEAAIARTAELEKTRDEQVGVAMEIAAAVAQAFDQISAGFEDSYAHAADNVQRLVEYQAAAEEYLTDAQKAQLDERIEGQKKAARAAFEAHKAAAIAQAIISTAVAVTQALASAPPPANFVLAGIAGAAGAVEVGTIAAQQPAFHSGGPIDLAPDEMSITARKSEYMLNPTGRKLLGDDALDRANAGVKPRGGGSTIAVSVYRHTRQVERWKEDGLLRNDPIAQAISSGKLVGQRSDRSV